jgi:hypothetical protein
LYHKLKNSYIPPQGFDFDMVPIWQDPVWQSDETYTTYNGDSEAKKLIDFVEDYAKYYATNHLFLLFGMDFQFMNAFQNYESMDRMIAYMNEHHSDRYHF